jgi:hypothetical protein
LHGRGRTGVHVVAHDREEDQASKVCKKTTEKVGPDVRGYPERKPRTRDALRVREAFARCGAFAPFDAKAGAKIERTDRQARRATLQGGQKAREPDRRSRLPRHGDWSAFSEVAGDDEEHVPAATSRAPDAAPSFVTAILPWRPSSSIVTSSTRAAPAESSIRIRGERPRNFAISSPADGQRAGAR